MLNVSCQKQKSCSSFPTDSLTESSMEFVGQPATSGAYNFLGVPVLSCLDVDDDDSDVVIGIRPRSSPLPRRRSSVTEDDLEFEPPPCGSRRVSFADAKGLSLVQVKKFDTWDVPLLPGFESPEGNGKDAEEFLLCPFNFTPPLSTEELVIKVQKQKVELESIELLPGTTIVKGVIRVLNICFNKAVYVRTTLDSWSSNFDLLAEYIPVSGDGVMDSFSFKIILVPPFGEQGARVDFCLRYETTVGTFWANNSNKNYVLFCHQKKKQQKEHLNKKSCLKNVSQNFSVVEDMSTAETSSQDMSADVSKGGEEVDNKEVNQISDGQSSTSEDDGQKLKTENRRNCSRRSRRKTARMAQLRDYFTQRDGVGNDGERGVSPPEAKEESVSEGDSKTDVCSSPYVDEVPATQSKTSHDDDEPDKPEYTHVSDSTTLTGMDPWYSEAVPAEGQSINKSSSTAEATSQKQGVDYENGTGGGTVVSVISESSQSLLSHATSFTFGTVVAPLYPQAFGRLGSENENPVLAKVSVADFSQTCPHTERRESSCTAAADTEINHGEFQEDVIKPQESNQECLDATLDAALPEKEKAPWSMAANDSLYHDIQLNPVEIQSSDQSSTNTTQTSGDITNHPQNGNILNMDLLNVQIPGETSHLQGNAQEEILTCDLQNQTGEEIEPPEGTCTQNKTILDKTFAQSERREDTDSQQTSLLSRRPPERGSEHVSDDAGQQACSGRANSLDSEDEASKEENISNTIIRSKTTASPEKDKLAEASRDLDPGHVNVSKKERDETLLETQEEINHMGDGNFHKDETHQSGETEVNGDVAESLTTTVMSKNQGYGDMFVELKDEGEVKATVSRQEGLEEITDIKNWEMMVEEEENNILTDEEESNALNVSAGDIEAVEKDSRELMEDTRGEKNQGTIEKKMEEESVEIADSGEEEDKTEEAGEVEDRGTIGKEEIMETVFGKEIKYVQDTMKENVAEEEGIVQVKRPEDEMNNFSEMKQVSISGTDIQEEDWIAGGGEMEIDSSDEDQVKTEEENTEEENPSYEVEIGDAESEFTAVAERQDEIGRLEERLDITQNKVEDGLSAPLGNVQEGADHSEIAEENTGEGQDAHVPTEMHLRKEEGLRSGESVTHDPSKAAGEESGSAAAAGGSPVPTAEPDREQDSASAESDSDDEVELYMHCLRAVHAGAQASKDQSQDSGLSPSKRPAACRRRRLSAPMPSISESLDEENISCLQVKQEVAAVADLQPTAPALSASSGQEGIGSSVSWWKETFSCSNISKTLLNATLLVVFLVVAYHYDFLACFGLYLITVVWLFCQGERQPVKNNKIG